MFQQRILGHMNALRVMQLGMLQIQPPYMFAVRPYLFCFVAEVLVVGCL